MRGQFFYMITLWVFVVFCHALFIWVARVKNWYGGKLPEMLKFPHIEVTLFIIFSMGMLDVALNVLATPNTAIGWKVYILKNFFEKEKTKQKTIILF
jgi:hypothetical protein